MGTLISETVFAELCKTRDSLIEEFGADNVSGIHLPWAGDQLLKPTKKQRSLYVVGIATAAEYAPDVPPNFEAAKTNLEREWRDEAEVRKNTPFWQFVSGLTSHMYGKRHYDCTDRWGWSNVFKIAYNEGAPSTWPESFFATQRDISVAALQSEFRQLRNSAIFIGWHDANEMLQLLLPKANWDKKFENDDIYFWNDDASENLYIWGSHPKYALTNLKMALPRVQSLLGPANLEG